MAHYLERVIDCVARTTRYPKEILTHDADLEIDLGIDSVKRLEITIAIGQEFNLPVEEQTREPWVRTIQDVANWVKQLDEKQGRASVATSSTASQSTRFDMPSPLAGTKQSTSQSGSSGSNPHSLLGKIAFVTGSGRGVGSVIAQLLAQQGATVIVNSFHSRDKGDLTTSEILERGGSARHVWGSVANPKHVDRMFDEIAEEYGKLDYLVCNASDGKVGSFLELTPEDWDKAFRTNVSGHYQCALRAAELMKSSGGGRIVTVSSVGSSGYIRGLGSQGIVKAAVENLTRYLACELGPWGIRVNCVLGGPVYGDLLDKFPDASESQNHWETLTPDGELCNPVDIAQTILFLLSDAARGVNGAIWPVDHGFSAVSDGRSSRPHSTTRLAMVR